MSAPPPNRTTTPPRSSSLSQPPVSAYGQEPHWRHSPPSGTASPPSFSPALPRPIPQHASSYHRPRPAAGLRSDSGTPGSSPAPSDTESSPSSNTTSPLPAISPLPTRASHYRRSSSSVFPPLDISEAPPSPPPSASANPEHLGASTTPLSLPTPATNPQSSPLSIAPPKRSFAATPSFPSPLARASIVPSRMEDDDEEETLSNADVEPVMLDKGHSLGGGGLFEIPGAGQAAARRRRASSLLPRQVARAGSPGISSLLSGPERGREGSGGGHLGAGGQGGGPGSPSTSSDSGSGGGDVNALGLLTRESSTRRRQASDTSSLRSIGLEGQTSGSVSTSPNRSQRRSDYLAPGSDTRKLSNNYPIPTPTSGSLPRPIPKSPTAPYSASFQSQVSPFNALPTPWGHSPRSSTSSSPTDSNFNNGAIRLQRVPTAVRLASDILGSSPSSSSSMASPIGKLAGGKTDFMIGSLSGGSHPSPLKSSLGPTDSNTSSNASLPLPPCPASSRWPTPEDSPQGPARSAITPAPSPSSESEPPFPQHQLSSADFASPFSSTRSAPKSFGVHTRDPRSRPSLPPQSAFDPLLLPLPTSRKPSENASTNHHRYRTSIHESPFPPPVDEREMVGSASNAQKGVAQDPEDYARIIMGSRNAKMQKWISSPVADRAAPSQHSFLAPPDVGPSMSWTPTDTSYNRASDLRPSSSFSAASPLAHLNQNEHLSRSRTLDAGDPTSLSQPPLNRAGSATSARALPSSLSHGPASPYLAATGMSRDIEWVDWLDEYKQFKEAKIRAEFESFQMPTTATARHSRTASSESNGFFASASGGVGMKTENSLSPTMISRSNSRQDVPTSSPNPTLQPRPPLPLQHSSSSGSGVDPLSTSPTASRSDLNQHRRSLSLRSQQAAGEIAKQSTQRLATFFERPRNASSSTTKSREAVPVEPPKTKKHFGSKVEGWWKSVKSNFLLDPPTLSSNAFKAPKKNSKSSSTSIQPPQSSVISLQHNLTPISRPDPSAPSSPTVVGFLPSSVVKSSPPVPTLRSATSVSGLNTSPTRARDARRDRLAPPVSLQPAFLSRPTRAISADSERDISGSIVESSSGGLSDETMSRPRDTTARSRLETRRKQPRLSLKLEKPSLSPRPNHPSHRNSLSPSNASQPRLPNLPSGSQPSNSRHSSYGNSGTDDVSSSSNQRRHWGQTPSPLYAVLPDDPRHPDESRKPEMTSQAFNTAAMHREIRDRLTTQKEVCNEQLRKIISSITNFVERKLQEAEDERNEMEHPEVFARGDDSQSDFGGDESDREPMPIRRTSRANSRRPSVNAMTVSPIKRQMMLPAAPGLSSPPRRRRSSAVPPRAFVESRLGRNLSNAMNGFPPNSAASSRSTSRSRSPMPPNASLESDRQSPSFGVEVGDSDSAIPSTFLATLQVVIDIATEVLDTSITALTSRPGSCPELVQKVQHIGSAWDDHPDWPERGWYVQLLLAVAGLSRVVEWWEAERGFWNFAEKDEDVEPITFVLKPEKAETRVVSPPVTRGSDLPSQPLGLGLGLGATGEGYSSIDARLDGSDVGEGERAASMAKPDVLVENAAVPEDLKVRVEEAKTANMVLELSLDGEFVEWINPAWMEIVGSDPSDILGQPINEHLAPADVAVLADATRELLKDDSHTVEARFRLQVLPELSDDDDVDREPGPVYREMTGSGMLMRDRISGEASHTMWVIKPVGPSSTNDAEEVTSSPEAAASGKLGISFHRRLLSTPVSPFPHGRRISTANLLCRICERQVPSWYFEKHNETCHEVHRLEADISERNEQVGDLLEKVQELAKDLETATPASPPVYRDMALFSLPTIPGDAFLSPSKPQQQIIREMQQSVVSQIVDILQTCLDISTPSIKDDALDLAVEHQRLLSPRSEDFMTLVNTWSKPTTEDPALAQLIQDASAASRSKLNAINRMRNTIVYSERVRHEWEDKVEKTLAALSEESDISDSSGSSHDGDEEQEEGEEDESALEVKPIDAARLQPPPLSASPVPMSFDTSSPSSTSLAPSSTAASSHILPSRSPQPSADASTATFLTPSCSSPYVSPPSIPVVSPTIPSHAPIPVSVRPRRLSRMPSHDPVFLSTPPISPPPGHEPSSRHRKLSNAGRASFGSEAQLSPRIPSTAPASRPTTISIKDFEIIKPISKGAFGSVYLAKKTTTGDFFAIKVLKKSDMISKNQITNVKAERKILMNQAESPYVVRLFYTFQNKHYLFLVMEYLPGGDLGALVKKLGTLGEDWTRGYIAEVVLGLESLHNKGVVHRDLKPDNLLIDAKGHLKLTDFGLSRIGLLGRQAGGSRFTIPRGKANRARPTHRASFGSRNQSIDSTDSPMFTPAPGSSVIGLNNSYFNRLAEADRYYAGSADESSGSESAPGLFRTPSRPGVAADVSFGSALGLGAKASPDGSTPPVPETHKFVGTVDYVAPESILGLGGDDAAVDWWALGVIMYEFLYGCPPFNDETPEKVFDNIISRRIYWPEDDDDDVSSVARDLMEKLMCTDPARRLGAQGAQEIKMHPFFADVDWSTVPTAEATFIPQVTDLTSTDYFDSRGLVELPEEFEAAVAAPETSVPLGSSPHKEKTDDFGAFDFRNLSASKAANDQVVQSMRAQAELEASLPTTDVIPPAHHHHNHERRKSVSKRAKPLVLQNPTTLHPGGAPSPVESASSSNTSSLPPASMPANGPPPSSTSTSFSSHSRRPSELERVQTDIDVLRRTSVPTRLRSSSTSRGSVASTPGVGGGAGSGTFLSPPSSTSMAGSIGTSPGSAVGEGGPTSSHAKVQVLLAEDNPVSLKVATGILTKLGMEVATVSTGSDTLAVATTCAFDVLLLDIRLPHLDADAIARYLKSVAGPNFDTPIVAVIPDDSIESERGTLFSAVIKKPITKESMLEILVRLGFKLGSSQQGQGVPSASLAPPPVANPSPTL